jgi:hypothetical protein
MNLSKGLMPSLETLKPLQGQALEALDDARIMFEQVRKQRKSILCDGRML